MAILLFTTVAMANGEQLKNLMVEYSCYQKINPLTKNISKLLKDNVSETSEVVLEI